MREMKPQNKFIPHLIALGAYLSLAVSMSYPLVLHMDRALPDYGGDGWKTYWNLWWVRHALLDLHSWPFFTPMLYAPTGTPLNFDQLAFFNDLATLPIHLLFNTFVAYNAAVLISFTLSGYAGYLLNRYLLGRALSSPRRFSRVHPVPAFVPRGPRSASRAGRDAARARRGIRGARSAAQGKSHLAAFIGGLIFAFAPTQFGRVMAGGQTLMAVEWLALLLLFTHEGTQAARFDLKRLSLAGACIALGALSDWYQLLWASIWLGLFTLARLWAIRRNGLRAIIAFGGRVALIGAAGAFFLSPVLVGMASSLLTSSGATFRVPYDHYVTSSADLLAFVTPPERHPLLGPLVLPLASRFTESYFEHTIFIGYVALLLIAVGLKRQWRVTRFWLGCGLIFIIYILGPILHVAGQEIFYPMPFEAFYRFVPTLAQFTRSVERGDTMVMLCLSVVAAFGAYHLIAPRPSRRWIWALPLLIAFEYLWIPFPATPLEVPAFYDQLAAEPGDFAIMHLPMEFNRTEDLAYQTVHGKRMTTGFTSREEPSIWLKRIPVLQHFRQRGYDVIAQDLKTVAPTVLRELGVRYIVIDYAQMPPPSDELYYLEDHGAELFGDQQPLYQDARLTVYAAPPVTRAVAYLRLENGWGILDPENWGTLQAEGWRTIVSGAALTVIAPEAQSLRLRFKAKAIRSTTLALSFDGSPIGRYEIDQQPRVFTSGSFPVKRGENRLTLAYEGPVDGVKINSLDVVEDR